MNMSYSSNSSSAPLNLPYTPDEFRQLDLSIVEWLSQLGVLSSLGIREADSICDLSKEIRNGVLLSALVSLMFNTRIVGIFKDPKTEVTCI